MDDQKDPSSIHWCTGPSGWTRDPYCVNCLMVHRFFRFCQMFQHYLQWSEMWKATSTQLSFKPTSSQVLSCYLKQRSEPPWTSYFVKYSSVLDDQRGWSHFNWHVGSSNYHVLRTGCYPYIKYHCSRRPHQDLTLEDRFFRFIKLINLGKCITIWKQNWVPPKWQALQTVSNRSYIALRLFYKYPLS